MLRSEFRNDEESLKETVTKKNNKQQRKRCMKTKTKKTNKETKPRIKSAADCSLEMKRKSERKKNIE